MPTIAIVDGVKILMFYNDHSPPHFHAVLGDDEMLVSILGTRQSGCIGVELDQMPRRAAAGKDLSVPKMLHNVIAAASADPATHEVTLVWANGETTVNRFGHLVGKGVFTALADNAVFARVGIGERGRSLEWPGDIDFCADALWFDAHPADAPGTGHAAVQHAAA